MPFRRPRWRSGARAAATPAGGAQEAVTARTMRSWICGRNSRMSSLSRVGWTRFESTMTCMWRSRSIEIARAREEAGVTSDTAHRVGVVVVDLATQNALPPRTTLGRGDHVGDRLEATGAQYCEVDERRGTEAERLEDLLVTEAIEGE